MRLFILLVSVLLVTPVYAEVVGETPSKKVLKTINNICSGIQTSRDNPNNPPKKLIEKYIANFHDKSKPDEATLHNAEVFWNKYHNHMICSMGTIAPEGRKKLHLTKMALQYNMFTPFFRDFFTDKNSGLDLNVNSVQWVNGKPETVIDYIDSILGNPVVQKYYNIREIKYVRKVLVKRYNAKTAKQLLEEKQSKRKSKYSFDLSGIAKMGDNLNTIATGLNSIAPKKE